MKGVGVMKKKLLSFVLIFSMMMESLCCVAQAADMKSLINSAPLTPARNELYGNRVDEILKECGYGKEDTYTVFKNCYLWLINNVRYRTADDPYSLMSAVMSFTIDQSYINAQAYAPLYEGYGVCNEYAGALYIMAQAIGLKPYYCTGETRKKGGGYTGHAWVELRLGGQLYVFDAQLEDNVASGGTVKYHYFGKTRKELGGSHILDEDAFREFKHANGYLEIERPEPVYSTDITLFIDGYPMNVYNVDGVLYVFANDLKNYGFRTKWDGINRTLYVVYTGKGTHENKDYVSSTSSNKIIGTAYNSDVKVFLNEMEFECLGMNDKMMVSLGFLKMFGELDPNADMSKFYLECKNTATIPGEVKVTIDGEKINFDQPPVIKDGRTLVPLRAIFEAMGAEVKWNDKTKEIKAVKDNRIIELKMDSPFIYVNGVKKVLDVPAQAIIGRTMVPARAIAEAFDCDVTWNKEIQTVEITK